MEEPLTRALEEPEAVAQSRTKLQPEGFSVVDSWRQARDISPFASNVALTLAGNLVVSASGFMTGPIVARLLGPAGRGQLAAVQNLYWFFATVAMMGIADASVYFTARRKEESGRILGSAIVLALLAFPAFFLIAFYSAPLLLVAQGGELIKTARWILLGIPLYGLCTIPAFVVRGQNDIARWNLLRMAQTIGWLLLLLGFLLWSRATPSDVAAGYLGTLSGAVAVTFLAVRNRVSPVGIDARYWAPMLRYGVPIALASIPLTLNLRLDQMVLAAFVPAKSLGIYVAAVSWSWAVPTLLHAIGTVLFPRLAGAEKAERGRLLAQSTRISFFIALVMAVGVAALTPVAIPFLFGKAFEESVNVGIILAFAAGVLGMNMVFGEGLRGVGQTKTILLGELAGLIATVGSLLWLLPRYGVLGAGISSVFGYSATALVGLMGVRRATQCSLRGLVLVNREDLRLAIDKLLAMRSSMVRA